MAKISNGKIGVIGGSGVYDLESIKLIKEHDISTPFGKPSDKIIEAEIDGSIFYFLPRHGRKHSYLPSEVNYRANIYALKSLGVKYLISISAVGSLKEECPPGSFVLPDQFIDWTKGQRERSYFGNGIVGHVSVAAPIDSEMQKFIHLCCLELKIPVRKDGSYICIEGPQFSSKAESNIYRSFGATVIGMTNVPESYLAKEAGMAYATIAMVTDYDCWKEVHCTLDEIMKVMKSNNVMAQALIKFAIPKLSKSPIQYHSENDIGIITPQDSMNEQQKKIVHTLLS